MDRYAYARARYAEIGVDTDAAIEHLASVPVSLHCWQGDDVTGFDHDGPSPAASRPPATIPARPARLSSSWRIWRRSSPSARAKRS